MGELKVIVIIVFCGNFWAAVGQYQTGSENLTVHGDSKRTVYKRDLSDPCLSSNHQYIRHLGQRYIHLEGYCPYTDDDIPDAWFHAGIDPMPTYPHVPEPCSCGYKFPIWLNDTLPRPDEGIVSRTTCLRFVTNICYLLYTIHMKNCGEFFVYRLPKPVTDAGFCFGVDKPGLRTNKPKISSVNPLLSTSTVGTTSPSAGFTTSDKQDVASGTTSVLSNTEGTTSHATELMTEEEKLVPPTGRITVEASNVTTTSLYATFEFHSGSYIQKAEVLLALYNGTVVDQMVLTSTRVQKSFEGLYPGTNYTLTMIVAQGGNTLDKRFVFTKPGVDSSVDVRRTVDTTEIYTVLRCLFTQSSDRKINVSWFVDHATRRFSVSKTGNPSSDEKDLYLTEEDLVFQKIFLPFEVTCAVGEINGEMSQPSEKFFAGIKLKTPVLTMNRDEIKTVVFHPTISAGCKALASDKTCNLTIAITVPEKRNCTGISTRKCRVTFSGKAGTEHEIEIYYTEDGQYGILKEVSFDLILRTIYMERWSIWNNYIVSMKVTVLPERDTYWRGRTCEARNDPHMFTFDSLQYEHHESFEDEYVLYQHKRFAVKVHHKLEKCGKNAMCNCGVAVQAGRDIYVISTCENTLEIGYRQCDDNVLVVKQESDFLYTIHLPYGTFIKARLHQTRFVSGMIITLSVHPSVHDQHGASQGLCGTLDNNKSNDFHGRKGQQLSSRTDFIFAWRVDHSESLFSADAWSSTLWTLPACSCNSHHGEVTLEDTCTLGADNQCSSGNTVGRTCKTINHSLTSDHSRPVDKNPPSLPIPSSESHTTASVPPRESWNHTSASKVCKSYMDSSRTFRLCSRVPFTDTGRAAETCTLDMVITQTTDWHSISRQTMQDACLTEVMRNKTFREHAEQQQAAKHETATVATSLNGHNGMQGTTNVTNADIELDMHELVSAIVAISCPNECSDHGSCKEGTCACDSGFGGDDCSIDLAIPPSATLLVHGDLCDKRYAECTEVSVYGGFFASGSALCHVSTYEVYAVKDDHQNVDAYVLRGQTESLLETVCPLVPTTRRQPVNDDAIRLLSCYRISVSNDGIHHGKSLEMCVYNSECTQLYNSTNGGLGAKIMDGYCFIDGKCVTEGTKNIDAFCSPDISIYGWTYKATTPSSTDTENLPVNFLPETWQTPLITSVTCVSFICLIVSVIICLRLRYTRLRKETVTKTEEPKVCFQPDFDEETYAYISSSDVTDYESVTGNIAVPPKNFKKSVWQENTSSTSEGNMDRNQYDRLNIYLQLTRRDGDKVEYDQLKEAQGVPALPDRPGAYENLKTTSRECPDYCSV